MVVLLVKFSIAAIPAAVILMVVGAVVMAGLGLLFGTGWHRRYLSRLPAEQRGVWHLQVPAYSRV